MCMSCQFAKFKVFANKRVARFHAFDTPLLFSPYSNFDLSHQALRTQEHQAIYCWIFPTGTLREFRPVRPNYRITTLPIIGQNRIQPAPPSERPNPFIRGCSGAARTQDSTNLSQLSASRDRRLGPIRDMWVGPAQHRPPGAWPRFNHFDSSSCDRPPLRISATLHHHITKPLWVLELFNNPPLQPRSQQTLSK
jgi:hypothetical protein